MTNDKNGRGAFFVIRISSLIRHPSFVIRHSSFRIICRTNARGRTPFESLAVRIRDPLQLDFAPD